MVKLLHTGDIHLDNPFTLEDVSRSEARRGELRETFSSVMNYIRANEIRLCLITGDVFDYEFATRETVSLVIREIENTPDCRFIISPGNHDPYTPNSIYAKTEFPSNAYIFRSAQMEKFEFPELGCDVYGYAFTAPFMETNPMIGVRPDDPERINILCAHGDTASPISKYCPVTERDIFDSGFDYVALGHIHNSQGIRREGNTYYAYCGCLEGRDYSESGYKGAIVGSISKENGEATVDLSQMRFSRRRYADERLNVTGASDPAEISAALTELITRENFGEDTLLRVTLEGSVSPALRVAAGDLAAVTGGLYSFELRDETLPLFDRDRLMHDNTIRGAYFRRMLPHLTHGTAEERSIAAAALRYGLGALDGADIIDF